MQSKLLEVRSEKRDSSRETVETAASSGESRGSNRETAERRDKQRIRSSIYADTPVTEVRVE